jgi:hypothetical protein
MTKFKQLPWKFHLVTCISGFVVLLIGMSVVSTKIEQHYKTLNGLSRWLDAGSGGLIYVLVSIYYRKFVEKCKKCGHHHNKNFYEEGELIFVKEEVPGVSRGIHMIAEKSNITCTVYMKPDMEIKLPPDIYNATYDGETVLVASYLVRPATFKETRDNPQRGKLSGQKFGI